jgi:uncharacterized protein
MKENDFSRFKVIDAHFHYSKIASFMSGAHKNGTDYSRTGWLKDCGENSVVAGLCMGVTERTHGGFPDKETPTPMNFDLDTKPSNFYFCAGINPHQLAVENIKELENTLKRPDCAGIKIYAGYYHYFVADSIYDPVYSLALKYDIPVVIHTGDTYSDRGLLKYSHPLTVDELSVKYPGLKIVICHFGNPWLMDTAEIIYKNKNVYADLSGLQVGDKELFGRFCSQELYLNTFRTALIFADRYDKIIYGSDWPLAPMKVYIDFIKMMIPEEHYGKVFYNNALNVFKKIKLAQIPPMS